LEIKERTKRIIELLDKEYGTKEHCFLNYETPWQLLIATVLSAQCTDARVNLVTKDLFKKYPNLEAFANANLEEMEQDIRSTGFYHNKAVNIIALSRELVLRFGGEVPSDINDLISLPGVGRKTANVIRGHIYKEPCVVVDTHVKRISKKLGVTREEDPVKIEFDLMKKIPKDHWTLWNKDLITLGRTICKAPTPSCEICFLKEVCKNYSGR